MLVICLDRGVTHFDVVDDRVEPSMERTSLNSINPLENLIFGNILSFQRVIK